MIFRPPTVFIGPMGPTIFLAGPIQGARNWQGQAIRMIKARYSGLGIASPRRLGSVRKEFSDKDRIAQYDWEIAFMQHAFNQGVIMFWLEEELEHDCNRAYGQTSRFELGEWFARCQLEKPRFQARAKLVVGISERFTNRRYIRHRIMRSGLPIPVLDNLRDTCKTAVEQALRP